MKLDELRMRLENKTAHLAVIGQGYVGLQANRDVFMIAEVSGGDVFERIRGCDAAVVMVDGGRVQMAGTPREVLGNAANHERLRSFLARIEMKH